MIRIGNQTSCWVPKITEPFDYARANGFDAFEFFPDKKANGVGWDETDLSAAARREIRDAARAQKMRLSVHARWQANPLQPESLILFAKDLELARNLGAVLFNIHLCHEQGVAAFVNAIAPLVRQTIESGIQLSIENTPHHAPELFNELFAKLRVAAPATTHWVGMCLDLGHANLCAATRNDYLGFIDRLDACVPIIHLHLHENWGDADTHLTLFTGPAGVDDTGLRGLLKRLQRRQFSGSVILEQWPQPPALLNQARDRFLDLVASQAPELVPSSCPTQSERARPTNGSAFENPLLGSTGDPPVPSGDSSDGTANALLPQPTPDSAASLSSSPVKDPQTGTGNSPVPPIDQKGSEQNQLDPPSNGTRLTDSETSGEASGPTAPPNSSATRQTAASAADEGFFSALVSGDKRSRSWREKLDSVRELFVSTNAPLTAEQLADLAIYLRFLGTGEIRCVEDGRHFRPSHHARIALEIEARLARLATPENEFILRRIYPWLPSSAPMFQRAEPLTHIRDIAHRNDIPSDLKREIKHSLQNKLHRCAGPEDLTTSARLLNRITAPGADYSPDFVDQFRIFHDELKAFFNARSLMERLNALLACVNAEQARLIRSFLEAKTKTGLPKQLAALRQLTHLRNALRSPEPGKDAFHRVPDFFPDPARKVRDGVESVLTTFMGTTHRPVSAAANQSGSIAEKHELVLADIGLEDFAFVLLSEIINALEAVPVASGDSGAFWEPLLEALLMATVNVALSGVQPGECRAIAAELRACSQGFDPAERESLLRIKATADRCRRIAEAYSDRVMGLFSARVERLGRALGVPEHALRVFCDAEIRAHLVFQISKLVSTLLRRVRIGLALPAWDVLVAGQVAGRARIAASIEELGPSFSEPIVAVLRRAEGDEEIPKDVTGIVLAHELPHLSHLGVRARQAGVVFVACEDAATFRQIESLEGQSIALIAAADSVQFEAAPATHALPAAARIASMIEDGQPDRRNAELHSAVPQACSLPDVRESETPGQVRRAADSKSAIRQTSSLRYDTRPATDESLVPTVALTISELNWIPLEGVSRQNGGGKADGARRLAELAEAPEAGFKTPGSVVIPFGVMERALREQPAIEAEYANLLRQIDRLDSDDWAVAIQRLQECIQQLRVPTEIATVASARFGFHQKLMVRSSANSEDLPEWAGAGLYESVPNVALEEIAAAVRAVWSSLWTRRAALSRKQAGIPHEWARMAVLIQGMVIPEFSFILHTVNPIENDPREIYVELAVGLGETLASASTRGTPYRLVCDKQNGAATTLALASFSEALWPGADGGVQRTIVDYSAVLLTRDAAARSELGRRLAAISRRLEAAFGHPLDVEGAVLGDEIFLVQARPQVGLRTSTPH